MQYKTAKAWNKTPLEWKLLNKEDKAIMMAFDKAEGMIEGWHSEEMEKKMKSEKKDNHSKQQPRKHADKRGV